MDPLREFQAIQSGLEQGVLCGAIADAVFPRVFDRTQRDKLAAALCDLTGVLFGRLDAIERRLAELEKHSHPPIDLTPLVRAEVERALAEDRRTVRRRLL